MHLRVGEGYDFLDMTSRLLKVTAHLRKPSNKPPPKGLLVLTACRCAWTEFGHSVATLHQIE